MEDPTVVVVSYSGKEINAKLVYYGAGLCGKTTNLESIYEAVPETSRGKMVSMKTQSDRTLFFDLLPLDLGEIMGFKTRFLLYTVPGQVFYNATRKLVLKGADAVVFVADSEVGKMDENKESLANLRANLTEYGLSLDEIPWVIQYNKRDLPEVYSVEELNAELNPGGKVPSFEAVATQGKGVFETFRGVSHLLMEKVTRELRRTPGSSRAARSDDSAAKTEVPSLGMLDAPLAGAARASGSGKPESLAVPVRAQAPTPPPGTVHYGRELSLTGETPATAGDGIGQSADTSAGPRAETAPMGTVRDLDDSAPSASIPSAQIEVTSFGTQLDLSQPIAASSPERPGVGGLGVQTISPPEHGRLASAAGPAAGAARDELIVPVNLPRGTTREIVLRIVLTTEDE